MRTQTLATLLVLTALIAPGPSPAAPAPASLRVEVDWPAFLARHDLLWDRMPRTWGEAAFTGNGLLGAALYASDDGRSLRWHIGRTDVTFESTQEGFQARNRLPIGDLVLVAPRARLTQMRLDLWNAEVVGSLGGDGKTRFRSFTAAGPMVQVVEITAPAGSEQMQLVWEPSVAQNTRLALMHAPVTDAERNPPPSLDAAGPVAVSTQSLRDGGEHATAWLERRLPDGRRVLYLSVGYARGKPGAARAEAEEAVAKAAEAGIDRLTEDHRAWWHAYWPESFVSIGNTRLESFYWLQMYKLASATRADRPMIDLMGPWFDRTPWPRIWWNLNAQLTYWPLLASNRLELAASLLRTLDDGAAALAQNAAPWSADSAAIGRTSSYDLVSPVTRELCNLPWAMHSYYLHYRYTMDDAMLRERLFPLLRRTVRYYLHLLEEGKDGRLHLPRGLSPEYDARGDHTDTTIDLALLRWGLGALLESDKRLGLKDPEAAEWQRTLARLAPYPTDANGLMVAADTPYATSHRHYSHLFPIYPLYLLRWDNPADRDLVERSFDHWMSQPESFRGYSWTGAASIAAAIGRREDAAAYLERLLDQKDFPILPNTMYRESGPVIETPLSGAAALHDLLLQSWGGTLRVFPGVPSTWKDAVFHDLRGQGAFLLSAIRRDGATRLVRVTSLAGEPCRIAPDMDRFRTEPTVSMRRTAPGIFDLGLKKGQSVLLIAAGDPGDRVIAPVTPQGPQNTFGVHEVAASVPAPLSAAQATPTPAGGPDNPIPSTAATVEMGRSGRLVYSADASGDTIPDFSYAGYHGGGVALPSVPVKRRVSPVAGDDGESIQAAIDFVGGLTPDADGFRGAILLAPGTYEIAGQIVMNESGVVLRGSGNSKDGTVLKATGTETRWLVKMGGAGGRTEVPDTRVPITNPYVSVGARSLTLASTAGLAVGDRIVVLRAPNQEWIDALGMDSCSSVGTTYDTSDVNGETCLQNPWTPEAYVGESERKVVAISGNAITLDIPIVHAIEARWGGGAVFKYTYEDRIARCGIENLYADSSYTGAEDEAHAYGLVNIVNIEDAWVRNVTAIHFYHGVVLAGAGAAFVTVQDSAAQDAVASPIGGRMYAFLVDDAQMTLVMRCTSRAARHDFVTGSLSPGPNVFLDSDATQSLSEMGPHHRYAVGSLWDDLTHKTASGSSYLGVVNRGNSGTGHGWAGANQVFWNNVGDKIRVQEPPYAHNWAFGCRAPHHDGDGEYTSWGVPVEPWSLYVQQLRERLGEGAVAAIGYKK